MADRDRALRSTTRKSQRELRRAVAGIDREIARHSKTLDQLIVKEMRCTAAYQQSEGSDWEYARLAELEAVRRDKEEMKMVVANLTVERGNLTSTYRQTEKASTHGSILHVRAITGDVMLRTLAGTDSEYLEMVTGNQAEIDAAARNILNVNEAYMTRSSGRRPPTAMKPTNTDVPDDLQRRLKDL